MGNLDKSSESKQSKQTADAPVERGYITPEEYAEFGDSVVRFNYFAEFKKYKTTKERDYCDQCGHFTGWISHEVGVGNPYRYRRAKGVLEVSMAVMNAEMYKSVMNSNDIFSRFDFEADTELSQQLALTQKPSRGHKENAKREEDNK